MKVPRTEKKLSTWESLDLGLEGMEAEGKGGGERDHMCCGKTLCIEVTSTNAEKASGQRGLCFGH